MFDWFKKKNQESKEEYKFVWYDIGGDNPFNKRILDIRSLTQTMISFTSDKSVAELFNKQRMSIGNELIGIDIPESKMVECSLIYPHNGAKIEGVCFKAKCMEDKWDIYGWNNIIYLTRSWTGAVVYKAFINVTDSNFTIYKIEYSPDIYTEADESLVKNNTHFLIMSLAFGAIYPHKVPNTISTEKDIALYSFAQFGKNCWYATFDDIWNTILIKKNGG
jgi:hypothetical protein